jgi:DNA replication protein DnaD
MHRGYIRLWRKYQESDFWKERRSFSKFEAWLDILTEARSNPEPEEVVIGMSVVTVSRGESIKSLKTWAARWGWSRSKTKRFLDLLSKLHMIRFKSDTKTTHLKVLNYDTYNELRNGNEHQSSINRTSIEHQSSTDNNDKNVKNDKNNNPPTPPGGNSERSKSVTSIEAKALATTFLDLTAKAHNQKLTTTASSTAKWLDKLLKRGQTTQDIDNAIKWLCGPNMEADFSFTVLSGKSLYEKWDRIQAAMKRNEQRGDMPF